ncbi:MAG: FtsQ-type POTRA domain-containing protein [Lachnospiraceae bacterium]|nr:FtsQ-type POTRA domain-containing protein [Lachnospiraceae bacterium]
MYRAEKNRRRKRKSIMILSFLAVIALLLGGIYYFLQTRTIKTVYVEGNIHYTKEEIQDMVMTGPLSGNSLYLSLVYKDKQITDIPFIASMNVQVLSPDTVKIVVYEKSLAGYVEYLGRYMYFDKDGTVVESSSVKTAGVPQITGLSFDHVVLGEPLPVEDSDIFYKILTVTKTLTKYSLTADRIYFSSGKEMTLYFGTVKVAMGTDSLLDEKIVLLQSLLPKLEGKSGTLNLQNYDENTGSIPFKPDS